MNYFLCYTLVLICTLIVNYFFWEGVYLTQGEE